LVGPAPAADNPKDRIAEANNQVRAKLAVPINLDKGFDPNTSLRDVLEYLGALRDVTIRINAKAFEEDLGIKEIGQQPISLPPQEAVPLDKVLKAILTQVKGGYLVRSGEIEVTTAVCTRPAAWGQKDFDRRKVPTVDALFSRVPLDQALRRLADDSGVTVVLDRALRADEEMPTISITLKGVPIDTAVHKVADLAEFKVVAEDDALYVTTEGRAKLWQKKRELRQRSKPKSGKSGNPPSQEGK
jgi:hypothetical protein